MRKPCANDVSRNRFEEILPVLQSVSKRTKPTLLIVDAQSVKNADTARHKGYDAGKKISGIKRHIAVDTHELPPAICVTTADVTDRKGALKAFTLHKKSLSKVVNVLADSGYTGQPFADGVHDILGASVQMPHAMSCTNSW